jgi:DNA primase
VERVLLRALAIEDPDNQQVRKIAAEAILQQPGWFEQLSVFPALRALAARQATDPMEVVDDPAQRALLAEALLKETRPPEENEVASSIQQIQERAIESRLRELRGLIADAERRGDVAQLTSLMKEKLELDKALRQLHNQLPPEH